MSEGLRLEVRDVVTDVLTGVYSEETRRPQPLRISVTVDLETPTLAFAPSMPMTASKDYMDLKTAIEGLPKDIHFVLIEAVASHICDMLFEKDRRVRRVEVEVVKLAISHNGSIGIRLARLAPFQSSRGEEN